MTDHNRFGDEQDRYRQDDDRIQDQRAGQDSRNEAGRHYGASPYGGSGDRAGRFGQPYGDGRSEDRSFSYDPYSGSNYGSSYGEEAYRARQFRDSQKQNRYDQRYGDRQAAGALLHQGYRAPFGDHTGYDRNEFRQYDGEGQRYQYNNYQPTYDQAGRYGHDQGLGADHAGSQRGRGLWDQTRDEVSSWFGDDEAARRRRQDSQRADHHGGKGPKGYTRSDDRIREDLNDRLTDDYQLDASDIDVKVEKGEVTLSGHVTHRSDKRRAEDLADAIGGVKHVQNNLRVKAQDNTASSSSSATAQTSGGLGANANSTANRSN